MDLRRRWTRRATSPSTTKCINIHVYIYIYIERERSIYSIAYYTLLSNNILPNQEEMDEEGNFPFDITDGRIGSISVSPGWTPTIYTICTTCVYIYIYIHTHTYNITYMYVYICI